MNEGPPKKPQESPELSLIQAQEVIDRVGSVAEFLRSYPFPEETAKEVSVLKATLENLDYMLDQRLDHGPAYIAFLRALEAVVSDHILWGILEGEQDPDKVATAHMQLRKYLAALTSIQIKQFDFTGLKPQ